MTPIQKLQRILPRRTKRQMVALMVAVFVGAQVETLTIASIQPFIMILTEPDIIYTNRWVRLLHGLVGYPSVNVFLAMLAFGVAGIYAFRGLYVYFLNIMQNRFTAINVADMSTRLLVKTLQKPYLFHTSFNSAKLQQQVMGSTNRLFGLINSVMTLFFDVFMAISILMFLLTSSPEMTLGVLGLASLSIVVYFRIFRHRIQQTGDEEERGMAEINKSVTQALHGIKEIKITNKEHFFINKFKDVRINTIKTQEKIKTLRQLPRLFIESLCFSGGFIVVAFSLLGGADHWELIPQLGVFVIAGFKLLPAISRMVNTITGIMRQARAINYVYDTLFGENHDYEPLEQEPVVGVASDDIIVSELSFKYPKSKARVFKNISLTIPHNKSVAFVGPSGAGKSTLVDVILGILAPTTGFVAHQGQSVHHHFEAFSQKIGYIPQSIYLLDDTIKNNVAFGVEPADIDEAKVWQALEQAQLKAFVLEQPEGLATEVGDRGVRLSGGQRQRIGIARALYTNPSILVMDEATSSLDNETEQEVMAAIQTLQGSKTMIIIAHRLSTIEHCDIVYEVKKGKVKQVR